MPELARRRCWRVTRPTVFKLFDCKRALVTGDSGTQPMSDLRSELASTQRLEGWRLQSNDVESVRLLEDPLLGLVSAATHWFQRQEMRCSPYFVPQFSWLTPVRLWSSSLCRWYVLWFYSRGGDKLASQVLAGSQSVWVWMAYQRFGWLSLDQPFISSNPPWKFTGVLVGCNIGAPNLKQGWSKDMWNKRQEVVIRDITILCVDGPEMGVPEC